MTLAAGLLKDFLIIENPQQEDFLSALEKINFQILPPNFIKLSLVDLVTKIFGDQNEIASMLSTGAFYHPCQEGSTYGLLYAMTGQWSRIEGGLGRITEILYQKAIQCGVKFKFNSRCLKLNYTDKGISSIECESAPSHSPDITILGTDGYAARKLLPKLFTDEPTHVSGTAMFHVVLKKDPNFPALHKLISLPTTICLTRSIPDLKESYYHYKNGEYFSNSIISLLPLGQNDEGSPMLIGQVHFAPESVDDKETYTKSIINLVEKNYPSFREDIQEIVFTLPQDIAANFGQDKINCFHTDLIWEKCMEKRSHIFGAGPTTPIKNVYICSSLIHPGGTVSGMPGYRCAQAILKKLKTV
jgi:phytoene dehydrogenase-like protein